MQDSKAHSAIIVILSIIFGLFTICCAELVNAADDFGGQQTLAHTTTSLVNNTIGFNKPSVKFSFYPERNEIEVIQRETSPWRYPEGGGPPDKVWKEIYGVVDGRIKLIKIINGEHHQMEMIDEYIEWPEE